MIKRLSKFGKRTSNAILIFVGIVMKTSRKYRITCLILAALMFFSSTGFSVNLHYCKGDLKSFSLIGEAKSCHAKMNKCPRHVEELSETHEESNCCSSESITIEELDANFDLVQSVELNDLQLKLITSFVQPFCISTKPDTKLNPYSNQECPYVSRDIYVLLERFLL